ncbi:methyl-accepting chemotaxis protein [Sphingomonas nostoxanthinifaciens]|uniref:methyl-accepting chemotaxis protein n=1 Tax=Sphingomonas nostoxanthinifaciens TaxID=2872652 RepID=UPI001CC1D02E|nr:methyl-accepting chemotaxis protein [Sphingomonas nostoxanthinifaciens]UAK26039.1 MCP four helix bundle domain-containing protein [Sphingomonas nostoxanthinifaciens]
MKNMRIATKLLVCFGGVAIVLAALAGMLMFDMSRMNTLSDTVISNRLPKVVLADELGIAVANYGTFQRAHILSPEPARRAMLEERLQQLGAVIHDHLKTLDAIIAVPAARAHLSAGQAAWRDYEAKAIQVRQLSRDAKNDEALAELRSADARFDDLQTEMAKLSEFEVGLAKGAGTDANEVYKNTLKVAMAALAVAFGLIAGILVLLIRAIAKPLVGMTKAMGELAAGNMSAEVPVDPRADEVGDLAKAMAMFRDQLAEAERSKQRQTDMLVSSVGTGLGQLADGNLTTRIDADLTGPFAKLKENFNHAVGTLQATMRSIAEGAGGINTGAGEIRQASDDLSHRTEQQAASLEETAAAIDQLTAAVRQTAEGADRANALVGEARADAEQGGQVVRRAIEAMSGIERGSNEISEIISVIDGIAFQTNLLALNAGVEAARAGDAGRGFAVVASEVRALAQRSADAAKDVKARVLSSSDQVNTGVQLVSETGRSLERIIVRVGDISQLVSEIAGAAQQQSTGLHEVNTAVGEMDSVTQQNAAMVEQATAAARSLAGEAAEFTRQVARFNLGDGASAAVARSPVHALQQRADQAIRRPAKPARGNAAVAIADDDWSNF